MIKEIRFHDVLQYEGFSNYQKRNSGKKDNFTHFKEQYARVKEFAPERLVYYIVASGIEKFPEWVDFLKETENDFEVRYEIHGWYHNNFQELSENQFKDQMIMAKDAITLTFGQIPKLIMPPRLKINEEMFGWSKELGLELLKTTYPPGRHIRKPTGGEGMDFHYWSPIDQENLNHLIRRKLSPSPIFIIGAPRSGTTALMRWYAKKYPDYTVLKEKEKHWLIDNPEEYYEQFNGKFIDKNARNTMRIKKIIKMFPNARIVNIVRDGRAVAYSWWLWSKKKKKEDQTLYGSAYQWVKNVTYIHRLIPILPNYRFHRYEDLCAKEDDFKSRNEKYKKNLTDDQIKMIEEIGDCPLRKYGYL